MSEQKPKAEYDYLEILKAKHNLPQRLPQSPWKHSRSTNPLREMELKHKKMIEIINRVIRLNNTGEKEITTYVI